MAQQDKDNLDKRLEREAVLSLPPEEDELEITSLFRKWLEKGDAAFEEHFKEMAEKEAKFPTE